MRFKTVDVLNLLFLKVKRYVCVCVCACVCLQLVEYFGYFIGQLLPLYRGKCKISAIVGLFY